MNIVFSHSRWLPATLLWVFSSGLCFGGGSGLNTVVVINQASSNSVALGNYYCEKRQVPPLNVVRISWPGSRVEWTLGEFQSYLQNPLISALFSRQLTGQVDYVMLSMDIPYKVVDSTGVNSTTSVLYYGFKADAAAPGPGLPASCSLPPNSANAFAGTEYIFRSVAPWSNAQRTNWMSLMITASNLPLAKLVVDQGSSSDGSFPTNAIYLAKSTDTARNIRYWTFDDAVFNTRVRGHGNLQRIDASSPFGLGTIAGAQTGAYSYGVPANAFVPGSMADNLTSFGGTIFQENDWQLKILELLAGGAAGSYGTVVEPCAYLEKFPTPQNQFYQTRGYTIGESYYMSVTNPYQGLLMGEPLAAPFAAPAALAWASPAENAVLSGTANLTLQANAADAQKPIHQVDLFLDGRLQTTMTNFSPAQNNTIALNVNGRAMNYTVPANATIRSITSDLTAVLNTPANASLTKVQAVAYGDRIELQGTDANLSGSQIPVSVGSAKGTAALLTTSIHASRSTLLDTTASGLRSFRISGSPAAGSTVTLTVTKTNGQVIVVSATAASADLAQLLQTLASNVAGHPSLEGADGLQVQDITGGTPQVDFNLSANSGGWKAAQIQARVQASAGLTLNPSTIQKLDENVSDLRPRNHLYVTAGLSNLPVSFALNTTGFSDGYHELTAVAYEGSHVRTQKRVSRTIRVQNTSLNASFNLLPSNATTTVVAATLPFAVTANSGSISRIDLFGTGGLLTNVMNQSAYVFAVPGERLGPGLHPFYAVVTATDGKSYRSETRWVRLLGTSDPFPLRISGPPPVLTWPAFAGRTYEVLSSLNPAGPFAPQATVIATNDTGQYADPGILPTTRFYRVRSAD